MESQPSPFPPASIVGHLIGWPTQGVGMICLALSVETENGGATFGLPSLIFAWWGFAGLFLLVIPGCLLALRPRLLGGPVGWSLRWIRRTSRRGPSGHQARLHDLGIDIACLGLAWCEPSALLTVLVLTLGYTPRAVLSGIAACLVLLPVCTIGYWRLLRRRRRPS